MGRIVNTMQRSVNMRINLSKKIKIIDPNIIKNVLGELYPITQENPVIPTKP